MESNEPKGELNRYGRRRIAFGKKGNRIMERGIQDSSEITLRDYLIEMKRKSQAGVEYSFLKRVRDLIDLKRK